MPTRRRFGPGGADHGGFEAALLQDGMNAFVVTSVIVFSPSMRCRYNNIVIGSAVRWPFSLPQRRADIYVTSRPVSGLRKGHGLAQPEGRKICGLVNAMGNLDPCIGVWMNECRREQRANVRRDTGLVGNGIFR